MATMTAATFELQSKRAAAYLARPLNLKEIRLPAGVCGSIKIGRANNNGSAIHIDPQLALAEGYAGIRLIGDGQTTLQCTSWDGVTLNVDRFPGVVQLEGVEWYPGFRCAMAFGGQVFDGRVEPKFQFRLLNSRVIAPEPAHLGGKRAMWLLFGYNYDEYLENVELDATQAIEHSRYRHGSAFRGSLWVNVKVRGSAGEELKDRPDATETAWHGDKAWTIVKRCQFGQWGQPWGNWQQGGGIILQNANTHVLVEDSLFRGRLGHPKCLHISSNGGAYDMTTGQVDRGYGAGYVGIRRCAFTGESDGFWQNELINVYRNSGGPPNAAMGVVIDGCAFYGRNTIVRVGNVPAGQTFVRNCNTADLEAMAERWGIDTTHETVIPTATRLVKVSEGYTR